MTKERLKGESQRQKFERAARETGAEQSEDAFDRQLKRVAKPQPKKEKPGK